MSRLVNRSSVNVLRMHQSSVDENVAMFLQYGLSEESEPTINDNVIAREIQQQYQNNIILDDAAIALVIQREEGNLPTSLSDDEKLARYLQQQDEQIFSHDFFLYSTLTILCFLQSAGNHSYMPERDVPSISRDFFHYEDGDYFSGHHTHTRTSSNISSVTSPNYPANENIDPANMTYEELNQLGESIGDVGRGLSQGRISKLPTHKYGTKTKTRWWQIKKKKFIATATECSICLVEYENGDKITTLPCKHIYHKDCISQWLEQNSVCCVCKAEV
ncbi:unnamed protein product [Thlaspi arvense]|uniref:RING-type domain-containing protein n=1 Tax=Thlaspi arvense TaxID=13288 RepID=A0AAU9STU2_THLAR|nr:unnamed protein product [Thlaspi arvense]